MDRTEIDIARNAGRTGETPTLPCRYELPDGRQLELNFLGPLDRDDLLAGFAGLSTRSRYLRFFSAMPELPDFMTNGLLNTDGKNHVAICARLVNTEGTRLPPIVGVARYFRASAANHMAEPAIAVVDDLHGLGLAKRLLRRLSAVARSNGITHFRAQVLYSNSRMHKILIGAGAQFEDDDGEVLTYSIDIRKSVDAPRGVLARLLAAMQGQR